MDYKALADNHVRSGLADSFGAAVATLIFMSASNSAGIPIHDLSRDDFLKLVDAVCGDSRVRDMWGEMGCEDKRRQWRSLA